MQSVPLDVWKVMRVAYTMIDGKGPGDAFEVSIVRNVAQPGQGRRRQKRVPKGVRLYDYFSTGVMRRSRTDYDWTSRVKRALTQRIYLMEAVDDNSDYQFKMMGNSGKPYDILVKDGEDITCSCPDHQLWGNFCKHIMHLLIRVIGIPQQQVFNHYYQEGNFTVGRETIYLVLNWFSKRKQGAIGDPAPEIPGQVKRKLIEDDDDCPVCYESFADTSSEQTIWCRAGCGKSIHQSCFFKWSEALDRADRLVSCVYCRSEWLWA